MKVRAKVDGALMSQAEQFFVFNTAPFENAEDGARLEAIEGAELARLWAGFDPAVWGA